MLTFLLFHSPLIQVAKYCGIPSQHRSWVGQVVYCYFFLIFGGQYYLELR